MNLKKELKNIKKDAKQPLGNALTNFIGFLINLSLLILLTEFFNLYYIISAAIGFLLATFATFILDKKFVFKTKKDQGKEVIKFFSVNLAMLGLNVLLLALLTETLGFFYVYSQILASAATFFIRFASNKYWIFRVKNP